MCCRRDEKVDAPLGPDEKGRKCTDVLILILFIVFNIGMIALMGFAFDEGDYRRVTNPVNFKGCVCGTESNYQSSKGKCVEGSGEELPSGGIFTFSYLNYTNKKSFDILPTLMVCASQCAPEMNGTNPGTGDEEGMFLLCADKDGAAQWGVGATLEEQEAYLMTEKGCGKDEILGTYDGHKLFGYCLPSSNSANKAFVSSVETSQLSAQWTQTIVSIERAKWVILGCAFAALVIGFLYLFSLKWCAGPLTWCAVFLIELLLVAAGVFMYMQSENLREAYNGSDSYKKDPSWEFSYYGAIVLFILAGLYLCLIVFLFRRIALALDMVEHASNLLYDTRSIVMLPVFMIIGGMAVTALWSVTAVYLYSTGELVSYKSDYVPGGVYHKFEINQDTRYALLYHLFGFFWNIQFLVALTEITISFVVVRWFFAARDTGGSNRKNVGPWPVTRAFQTVLRFHLGSVAFGSLIIAIIKFIRAMIEYARRRLRKGNQDSQLVRWLLCLCACYFWCLDKFMHFINKNAYTVIALTKKGFCSAAYEAFTFIVANAIRVATLNAVSTIFLGFGKWFVALSTTALAYIIIISDPALSDPTSPTAVSSPFFPCLVVFLFAYAAGSLFMALYDVTIDAMLLCFLYDEKYKIIDPTTKADIGVNINALSDQCNQQLGTETHGFSSDEQRAAKERLGNSEKPNSDYNPAVGIGN